MRFSAFCLALLLAAPALAQTGPPAAPLPPGVLSVVDQQAELIGGLAGLHSRLVYPTVAREAGMSGRVVVQFVVNERGRVTPYDSFCLQSPGQPLCDAAIEALQQSEFTPGMNEGEAVKTSLTLPIDFLLDATATLPAPAAPLAERSPEASGETDIYEVVEIKPELIGGLGELQQRVVYPEMARRAGMEGKVFVQFVVEPDGTVGDVRAIRCPNELLCEAGMQAVRESRFTPGMQKGKPVRVRFTLPIDFKLRDDGPVQPGTVATSALINSVLGMAWSEAEMEDMVGAPLFGAIEGGNGRLQYADSDPAIERILLIVRDGVMQAFEADFIGPEAVADLTAMKAEIVADIGAPADGDAFTPEQLKVARRFTIWPEQRRLRLEYAPLAPEAAE